MSIHIMTTLFCYNKRSSDAGIVISYFSEPITIGLLFDLLLQARNQSVAETTFGRMSDLIGSFMAYPKKDERGS